MHQVGGLPIGRERTGGLAPLGEQARLGTGPVERAQSVEQLADRRPLGEPLRIAPEDRALVVGSGGRSLASSQRAKARADFQSS